VKRVAAVVVGAGQSGLAMSRCLSDRSVDHVVLERGEVANSWRNERWDSLRLLTPNWQGRLPGSAYEGPDPDGYMTMPEVIDRLGRYAADSGAPVQTDTEVLSVKASAGGYHVETTGGDYRCANVVIASGACNLARVPALAAELPGTIHSVTPLTYKRPSELPEGDVLVVGASATGIQLAVEIQASGRQVTLAAGEHVRVPRRYRGRDIMYWMDALGVMDQRHDEVEDINRARRTPSLQLTGSALAQTTDLNWLSSHGVEVVGRLVGFRDGRAQFSGSLPNVCMLADLKMNRLLDAIDRWAAERGLDDAIAPPDQLASTKVPADGPLEMNLNDGRVRTVIWATGYRPDYSWFHIPVLDRKGRLRHQGGVVDAPGIYAMGLPFMRRRKSTFIDGAGDDARDLADHMVSQSGRLAA
jgi:putative flavoprotein involved in K+ transport